jgi:hypothetical protein
MAKEFSLLQTIIQHPMLEDNKKLICLSMPDP